MNVFGSLLSQVKPYFDGRDLVSAFSPSLIAWSLTAWIVVLASGRVDEVMAWWDAEGGVAKALVATGFVVWVLFWSYLTVTARPLILRLFSGEVKGRLAGLVYDRLKDAQERDFEALVTEDLGWERQLKSLARLEETAVPAALLEAARTAASEAGPYDREVAASVAAEIDPMLRDGSEAWAGRVADVRARRSGVAGDRDSPAEAPAALRAQERSVSEWTDLAVRVIGCWERAGAVLYAEKAPEDWVERRETLEDLTRVILEDLPSQRRRVENGRQDVTGRLFRRFPNEREELTPTGLGNVLRTAEIYPWKRYRLDAAVAWSRLEPSLDTEFAASLQKTRTTLELMLTLSAFAVLFGVPLSIISAIYIPGLLYWWAPVVVAVGSLAFGFRMAGILAGVALLLSLLLDSGTLARSQWWIGAQLLAFGLAVVVSLSGLTYQSAVQAAGPYAEKLKAAFDLYRWKLLESLKLKLPDTRARERQLWEALGQLLYRGDEPDSALFRYAHDENVLAPPPSPPATAPAVIAKRPLEAFVAMSDDDLAVEEVLRSSLPRQVLTDAAEGLGLCPLVPLPPETPISRADLIEPDELSDIVTVGVPATRAMTFGGSLSRGDRVGVSVIEASWSRRKEPLSDVLVVDVHETPSDEKEGPGYIVVLGLPRDRAEDFLEACARGNVALTRDLPKSP